MGRFNAEVVEGAVILRRKVAEAAATPPVPQEPTQLEDKGARDKGTEAVTEESPDPKPEPEKPRRRPRADEVSDG